MFGIHYLHIRDWIVFVAGFYIVLERAVIVVGHYGIIPDSPPHKVELALKLAKQFALR